MVLLLLILAQPRQHSRMSQATTTVSRPCLMPPMARMQMQQQATTSMPRPCLMPPMERLLMQQRPQRPRQQARTTLHTLLYAGNRAWYGNRAHMT
jgi:hypothetical protein